MRARMRTLDVALFFLVYSSAPPFPWLAIMVTFSVVGGGNALVAIVPFAFFRRTRTVTMRALVAIGFTAIAVYTTKPLFHRTRPYLALEGVRPFGLPPPPHDPSFPSGHAAGAACFAAFFADRKRPVRTGVLFVSAALVGLSRVVLGVHFPLDVVCGACLGGAVGAGTARHFASRDRG